jgi:hypothetical protein
MADCTAIKNRLDSAITARDRLITGSQVVVISDAQRSRVEYRPADLSTLTAHIAQLQAEYNACVNPGQPVQALTRPIKFVF